VVTTGCIKVETRWAASFKRQIKFNLISIKIREALVL